MKIGITTSVGRRPDGTLHPDVAQYVRAVERAGAEAVLFANDVRRLDESLAQVAGVVFGGGVDVDVTLYGGHAEHSRSQARRYSAERDGFEIALLHAVRERSVPTLCVCRGVQIASVAYGGTLIEDLRDELRERYTIEHRKTDGAGNECAHYAAGHAVSLAPQSALARLLGQTEFPTNSMHHQAIRTLGQGLAAVGHTADGVIEAIEASFAHPFFYGVQWHPEALEDAVGERLFGGLIRAAREASTAASGNVRVASEENR